MQEIICTDRLIHSLDLQLADSGSLHEGWAADLIRAGKSHFVCFLHLPTQYFMLAGPTEGMGKVDLRHLFEKSLVAALETDRFDVELRDGLLGRFETMGLHSGMLSEKHLHLFEVFQNAFELYVQAVGHTMDKDEFAAQVRHEPGIQLAAVTPRNTLQLWAESTAFDAE